MQNISEETVRSVIGRYGDMVMRIAYQNTRDRAESEDIVQEVFLALFLRIPAIVPSRKTSCRKFSSRSFCALFPRARNT